MEIKKEQFKDVEFFTAEDEYKKAYEYLLEYWDSYTKEQQQQINTDLNKIFVKNTHEQVE